MADPSDKRTRIGTPAPRNQTGGQPVYPAQTPAPYPVATPPPVTMQSDLPANIPAAGVPAYAPPPDPLIGQVLAGRYHIQKKLGEGGMGAVYLATHIVLEKQVALKVLHGEYARKADLVERFMQEAKAASRIRHENVIDISDFGSTPDGLVFFAMELLRGHDLHEEIARARLSGQRLPWERTRPIFLQICSALSAAHAQGIVHRDLKPENIYLVEWLGHKDFVKLLDFGIAKLTESADGDRKLTKTGMLFGTPEYMSPEQARGEPVDHRVDIYAMGCILYQMVTGRVPFEAENFMGILSLHLTEIPPPIGAPILNQIGAPLGLEAIIMKALAKNRDERYQAIDEMANAIRALHGESQISVQMPTVPRATGPARTVWTGQVSVPTEDEPPARRAKGSKLPLVLGAIVLAGAAGGAAFLLTRKSTGGTGGGSGSSNPVAAIDAGAKVAAATPDASAAPLPAHVHLVLQSVPTGAEIFDLTTQKPIGPTPMEFDIDGSHEARKYRLTLAGYIAKVIELVPDEEVPPYTSNMTKLAGAAASAASEEVEVVPQNGRKTPTAPTKVGTGTGTGSDVGPVTHPEDAGTKTPDKTPDKTPTKTPTKTPDKTPTKTPGKTPDKIPDKTPDKIPDKTPDKVPDPGGDDDEPHIKNPFPTGSGSGS